jgi:hypothetical protein
MRPHKDPLGFQGLHKYTLRDGGPLLVRVVVGWRPQERLELVGAERPRLQEGLRDRLDALEMLPDECARLLIEILEDLRRRALTGAPPPPEMRQILRGEQRPRVLKVGAGRGRQIEAREAAHLARHPRHRDAEERVAIDDPPWQPRRRVPAAVWMDTEGAGRVPLVPAHHGMPRFVPGDGAEIGTDGTLQPAATGGAAPGGREALLLS